MVGREAWRRQWSCGLLDHDCQQCERRATGKSGFLQCFFSLMFPEELTRKISVSIKHHLRSFSLAKSAVDLLADFLKLVTRRLVKMHFAAAKQTSRRHRYFENMLNCFFNFEFEFAAGFRRSLLLLAVSFAVLLPTEISVADDRVLRETILPIMESHCFDCHTNGGEEGGVTFDFLVDAENPTAGNPELWRRVLTQLRTGLMPPPDADSLEPEQVVELESWIIRSAFQHDAADPDPGRVTVRRLNRMEYRNTIRDLLGVNYNTALNFPPDDTGEGFDNVADVLSISPMLMEKYIAAAQEVVSQVVPVVGQQIPRQEFFGHNFKVPAAAIRGNKLSMLYYDPVTATLDFEIDLAQQYAVEFGLLLAEDYVEDAIDLNRCRVKIFLDDEELLSQEYSRNPWKSFSHSFQRNLEAGRHQLRFELEPLTKEEPARKLQIRIEDLMVKGPLGDEFLEVPAAHAKFFTRPIPDSEQERLDYAAELLRPFLLRAFRRPADDETVERLCEIAQLVWQSSAGSFETGIRQAMIAALASPRFLFREQMTQSSDSQRSGLIDEFSLATRLSYFLWSTMPDAELFQLASENRLRENMDQQLDRMIADEKFGSFYRNFVGQWLRTRDVEGVAINTFSVLLRESTDPNIMAAIDRMAELEEDRGRLSGQEWDERNAIRELLRPIRLQSRKVDFDRKLRSAMRRETEMLVEHLVLENKSLLQLVDCDYTFLNERLAKHYGIEGVQGEQMRMVDLPAGSLRGGVLAHGSMLAVTSNPDRTSPVKRGLFLLDNVLGIPTGAPPPDIPSLESSEVLDSGKRISLRDALAIHRESELCSSCHNRMDPLGLALENFDPMGRQRDDESIDVSGELVTGESFENLNELKKILVTHHQQEIYRCITEKTLTYALGRSLEYYDVPTVGAIVQRLEKTDGKAMELMRGVINSVAFQKKRRDDWDRQTKNK